jgi:predicted DNA-binding protein (UPF0251 family)
MFYGVYWINPNTKKPCYPQFNKLNDYISRSKIDGIHGQYSLASQEISEWYNELTAKIDELEAENRALTNAENMEKVKNIKTYPAPISGRKPKALGVMEIEKMKRMRSDGVSFDDIGRTYGVSSRTVRRAVNGEAAYK